MNKLIKAVTGGELVRRSAKLRAKPKARRAAGIVDVEAKAGHVAERASVATDNADSVRDRVVGVKDGDSCGSGGCVGTATTAVTGSGAAAADTASLTPGWADDLGQQLAGADRDPNRRQFKRTDEQRFKMSMSQRARWAARKGQCSG